MGEEEGSTDSITLPSDRAQVPRNRCGEPLHRPGGLEQVPNRRLHLRDCDFGPASHARHMAMAPSFYG
jgi:hypothetical protein